MPDGRLNAAEEAGLCVGDVLVSVSGFCVLGNFQQVSTGYELTIYPYYSKGAHGCTDKSTGSILVGVSRSLCTVTGTGLSDGKLCSILFYFSRVKYTNIAHNCSGR